MGEIKNLVSLSSSMAHITFICGKGTIHSILHVTSECQTMPWKCPAESTCKSQTGGLRWEQMFPSFIFRENILCHRGMN